MKKVVSLLLVCLMAFSLAACNSKEVVNETPVEEVVPEVKVENDIVLKGEFLSEYAELDANDINKFIGTAIVNVRPEEFRKNDIPVVSKDSPYSDLIFTLFHVKEEYFDKYALSTSQSNTRAYTVAVIKANYGYEEDILNGFGERLTDLYNNVKDYPDQLYILENAIIEQVGDYLFMIVCDNAEDVFEELQNVMRNTDLTSIKVVPFMTDAEREEIEKKALEENIEIEAEIEDVIVTPVEDIEIIPDTEEASVELPTEDVSVNTDTEIVNSASTSETN